MRAALLLLLAGCPLSPGDSDPDHCHSDAVCATGEVCARTSTCVAALQVRAVHVTWTLAGMAASQTTCSSSPDLAIEFQSDDPGAGLTFAPVPCVAGKFSIDKLPRSYRHVALGLDKLGWQSGPIDDTGAVSLDLPF